MLHRLDGRISAAAALFCLLTLAAAPRAHAQTVPVTQSAATTLGACLVTVTNPDSVKIAATPITLQASVTAAIGDSISATVPDSSKISVVSVTPAADSSKSVEVTVNTSQALPGEWPLSLKGTQGACTGKITIPKSEP